MSIRTHYEWDTDGIYAFAQTTRLLAHACDATQTHPGDARRKLEDFSGLTSEAVENYLRKLESLHNSFGEDLSTLSHASYDLADALRKAARTLRECRSWASSEGLRLRGTEIFPPSLYDLEDEEEEYYRQSMVYSEIQWQAVRAAEDAQEAFTTFSSVCAPLFEDAVDRSSFFTRIMKDSLSDPYPRFDGSPWQNRASGASSALFYAESIMNLAVGVDKWYAGATLKADRYTKWIPFEKVQKFAAGYRLENWEIPKDATRLVDVAKTKLPGVTQFVEDASGKAAPYIQKAAPFAKGAVEIGGAALTGVVAAIDQWNEDARDPELSTGTRVARASVNAVSVGLGALAGAKGGAWVGAAIGSLGGPIGTAVGGIVGGLIGGAIGAWLGEGTSDFFNDYYIF